jgi:hypothetical protein
VGDKKKLEKQAAKQEKRARQGARTGSSGLPQNRADLTDLHRETRARRNAAAHGSKEHVAAIELIGRIEVEIARIERAMDPPLG